MLILICTNQSINYSYSYVELVQDRPLEVEWILSCVVFYVKWRRFRCLIKEIEEFLICKANNFNQE